VASTSIIKTAKALRGARQHRWSRSNASEDAGFILSRSRFRRHEGLGQASRRDASAQAYRGSLRRPPVTKAIIQETGQLLPSLEFRRRIRLLVRLATNERPLFAAPFSNDATKRLFRGNAKHQDPPSDSLPTLVVATHDPSLKRAREVERSTGVVSVCLAKKHFWQMCVAEVEELRRSRGSVHKILARVFWVRECVSQIRFDCSA